MIQYEKEVAAATEPPEDSSLFHHLLRALVKVLYSILQYFTVHEKKPIKHLIKVTVQNNTE